MSDVYFTADTHVGHGNILKYAQRPELQADDLTPDGQWISQEILTRRTHQMNERLIAKWNARVKPGDTVYHLGDFCCKGNERGLAGDRTKAQAWLDRLNGTKVMILGNHDGNNGLKRGLEYAVLHAGGLKFLLCHDALKRAHVCLECDVVLCGHVHRAWAERWIPPTEKARRLAINVGVDVRKYAPIKLDEVIGIATRMLKEYEKTGIYNNTGRPL